MLEKLTGLKPRDLEARGLIVNEGKTIVGSLVYERPAWVFDPRRIKNCTLGAFTLINGLVTSSLYRCRIGRYGQIGEGTILGPPEHPQDWFSSHPFAFTQPRYMPNMYRLPEFVDLAPDDSAEHSFIDTVPKDTIIGHEAYIGAGSFVKRGVRIGDGAVVGACSVVTRDVAPYTIVAGVPARPIKLRFSENIVERMLALQWWRYDLAPHKQQVDFSRVERTLDYFEGRIADGTLRELRPDTWRVTPKAEGFEVERLPAPLFWP